MSISCITTVTSAATNFDLTTIDNVKIDLSIDDTDEDDFLARAITKSSAAISQYCNRTFALQTYQDLIRPQRDVFPFFPSSGQPLMVNKPQLVSVTSLTEDAIALVSGTDFEVDPENGFLYRLDGSGNRWSWPGLNIVITYTAGWTLGVSGNLPADVEDACVRMVRNARTIHSREVGLKTQDIVGVERREYWVNADGGNLTPDVSDILNNYRITTIG